MARYGFVFAPLLVVALAGCGSGGAAMPSAATTTDESTPAVTARNIMEIPNFKPLETATYFIDPDNDASTPLRVMYTIAAPLRGDFTTHRRRDLRLPRQASGVDRPQDRLR